MASGCAGRTSRQSPICSRQPGSGPSSTAERIPLRLPTAYRLLPTADCGSLPTIRSVLIQIHARKVFLSTFTADAVTEVRVRMLTDILFYLMVVTLVIPDSLAVGTEGQ